ncbi:MAG: LysM peptidoglycan-binding domain-containing protein [Verrucomicrobiota bacterium]
MMRRAQGAILLGLALATGTGGCGWLNRPGGDPRKDPNYQDGLAWKDQGRYDIARTSFERAADVNPANRYAHLELGFLHLEQLRDPVAAIYHFQRYLALAQRQESAGFRDPVVEGRITSAKIQLAMQYSDQIGRQESQVRLDELRRRNEDLDQQVRLLTQQLQLARQQQLTNPAAPIAPLAPDPTPAPTTAPTEPRPIPTPPPLAVTRPSTPLTPVVPPREPTPPTHRAHPPAPARPAAVRTYVIQSGDTPGRIAQRFNIRVDALLAANPGVDPRRLKVGRSLNIPSPPP